MNPTEELHVNFASDPCIFFISINIRKISLVITFTFVTTKTLTKNLIKALIFKELKMYFQFLLNSEIAPMTTSSQIV